MIGLGGGVSPNHVSKRAGCKNTLSKMLCVALFRGELSAQPTKIR
jgi:hypothetical protein